MLWETVDEQTRVGNQQARSTFYFPIKSTARPQHFHIKSADVSGSVIGVLRQEVHQ
jgi:hypothetical protein